MNQHQVSEICSNVTGRYTLAKLHHHSLVGIIFFRQETPISTTCSFLHEMQEPCKKRNFSRKSCFKAQKQITNQTIVTFIKPKL